MKYFGKTTAWNNGCAFACVAELLQSKIGSPDWPAIQYLPNYIKLLEAFARIYNKPELNWKDIFTILESFSHPHDQQVLWVSPLRQLLEQVLLGNKNYRHTHYNTFIAALREFVIQMKRLQQMNILIFPTVIVSFLPLLGRPTRMLQMLKKAELNKKFLMMKNYKHIGINRVI